MVESTSDDNANDAEQMRLAFQAFMLKGKGATTKVESSDASATTTAKSNSSKKKKKKKRPSTGVSPQKAVSNEEITTPVSAENEEQVSSTTPNKLDQSSKKRYYQLLRSFCNKIQQSWFEIDDQILDIIESIVSIRARLPLEWKILNSFKNDNRRDYEEEFKEENMTDNWKYFGFRGKTKALNYPAHMQRADVHLALEHDLEQQEKMITSLRSLISELSECHESLGRLVDTIWKFHLDCQVQGFSEICYDGGDNSNGNFDMDILVQNATDLFRVLSTELYRKQSLIPLMIESINDGLLLGGNSLGFDGRSVHTESTKSTVTSGEDLPLSVARRCYKCWPRKVDEELMLWIVKMV
ncbi:hypothetical protein HJC23_010929 [Cyclotella cryptica]|uniref:Uncharacterized protein n=1 Tax=Cyclotella cryptica TaxID=29204 RepID=A0ABD3Q8W0_9STRA|eukprot:CCRYP_007563-RA/>CCRYP_007563-RA protein AED:0.09 eAED:0.09 QI:0/-1/0/1/-1/1/1/0/353